MKRCSYWNMDEMQVGTKSETDEILLIVTFISYSYSYIIYSSDDSKSISWIILNDPLLPHYWPGLRMVMPRSLSVCPTLLSPTAGLHVLQRMTTNDFGDLATFPPTRPSGQILHLHTYKNIIDKLLWNSLHGKLQTRQQEPLDAAWGRAWNEQTRAAASLSLLCSVCLHLYRKNIRFCDFSAFSGSPPFLFVKPSPLFPWIYRAKSYSPDDESFLFKELCGLYCKLSQHPTYHDNLGKGGWASSALIDWCTEVTELETGNTCTEEARTSGPF